MDKRENEKSPETGETTEVVVNIIRFILNLGVGAIGLVCNGTKLRTWKFITTC